MTAKSASQGLHHVQTTQIVRIAAFPIGDLPNRTKHQRAKCHGGFVTVQAFTHDRFSAHLMLEIGDTDLVALSIWGEACQSGNEVSNDMLLAQDSAALTIGITQPS